MNRGRDNNAETIARAFATYALVPYLGILFCPGALVMGGVGVVKCFRFPETPDRGASRNACLIMMFVATLELAAQLTLWWIMYKVPEWSRTAL